MLISIIIPIFNVQDYVEACLESVLAQTHPDFEIILIDDMSTDNSIARCARFLKNPRVRLIRHDRNRGLSAARNTGIDNAQGDYLLFVDLDDVVSPTLVEQCVVAQGCHDAPIVIFGFVSFADGEVTSFPMMGPSSVELLRIEPGDATMFAPPFFAWLKFLNRHWLTDNLIRFREGELYEDHRFHWSLAASGAVMTKIAMPLYGYRIREGSITTSTTNAVVRLEILDDLVTEYDGQVAPAAIEVGEQNILRACIGLLATCPPRELRAMVGRVCERAARIASRRPNLRPAATSERLLLGISRHNNAASKALLTTLIRSVQSVRQLQRRFLK